VDGAAGAGRTVTGSWETSHTLTSIDESGIGVLEITNAGPLNILNTPVICDVTSAVKGLAVLPGLRALVLRGAGDRAFIGGADIKEMVHLRRETAVEFISRIAGLCETLRQFPTPVIARLSGWCLGAGLEVAVACDLRISSGDARFGMPEVAVGIPSVIHAALLPRLIGNGRARWLLLTGRSITAASALSWGLIDEVYSGAELDSAVTAVARGLTGLGPDAVRRQKALLRSWEDASIDDAVKASIEEFGSAFDTSEPEKFMTEFLTARKKGARALDASPSRSSRTPLPASPG
jgi:enoyl-CoA hydratase/carnithine racemase